MKQQKQQIRGTDLPEFKERQRTWSYFSAMYVAAIGFTLKAKTIRQDELTV